MSSVEARLAHAILFVYWFTFVTQQKYKNGHIIYGKKLRRHEIIT